VFNYDFSGILLQYYTILQKHGYAWRNYKTRCYFDVLGQITNSSKISKLILISSFCLDTKGPKDQGLLLISHICMHHRKSRKTRLVRFVRLPDMVEACVLRYAYSFVHSHAPFW
jgi:hypothetical protein